MYDLIRLDLLLKMRFPEYQGYRIQRELVGFKNEAVDPFKSENQIFDDRVFLIFSKKVPSEFLQMYLGSGVMPNVQDERVEFYRFNGLMYHLLCQLEPRYQSVLADPAKDASYELESGVLTTLFSSISFERMYCEQLLMLLTGKQRRITVDFESDDYLELSRIADLDIKPIIQEKNKTGVVAIKSADYRNAVSLFRELVILSDLSGQPELLATAYHNLGTAYFKLEQYDLALQSYLLAYKLRLTHDLKMGSTADKVKLCFKNFAKQTAKEQAAIQEKAMSSVGKMMGGVSSMLGVDPGMMQQSMKIAQQMMGGQAALAGMQKAIDEAQLMHDMQGAGGKQPQCPMQ